MKMVRRQQEGRGDWNSADRYGGARFELLERIRRPGRGPRFRKGDLAAGRRKQIIAVRHAIGSQPYEAVKRREFLRNLQARSANNPSAGQRSWPRRQHRILHLSSTLSIF